MKACKEYIINSENSIFTVCATDDEITAEIDNDFDNEEDSFYDWSYRQYGLVRLSGTL